MTLWPNKYTANQQTALINQALFPMEDTIADPQYANSKNQSDQESYNPTQQLIRYFPIHPRLNPIKSYETYDKNKYMRKPLHN